MSSNDRLVKPSSGYFSRIDTAKPQIGIVKQNIDEERMGRLKVWIKGSTAPENDPSGWVWVNYGSPFAGATSTDLLGGNVESFDSTQKSYGFWGTIPDLGNEVIILFINGDIRDGFWIGSLYHKNMNQMVPGISEGVAYQRNSSPFNETENPSIPVAEYNKLSRNQNIAPYYKPLADGLVRQGLLSDDLRGAGSSSARRESPSRVQGWLTPGGNQLIMDDGVNSELIRIRTKSGAQILISETIGNIYVISRDGNSWLELTNDGFIDLYGVEDISIRSEGTINLRADKNINLEAGDGIYFKAQGTSGMKFHAPIGDINESAINRISTLTGNVEFQAVDGRIDCSGNISLLNQNIFLTSSQHINLLASSQIRLTCSDDMSLITSERIILNADEITANDIDGTPAGAGTPASNAVTPPTVIKLDKDYDKVSGPKDVNLETILNRVPHHEPWPDHQVSVLGTRESVEETDNPASPGSVSPSAATPLPVVGSPRSGMTPGIYSPTGYIGNQPQYEFIGMTSALKDPKQLTLSEAGLQLIARFEGFSSNIYLDVAGKATIGYGHLITGREKIPLAQGISKDQALQLLKEDAQVAMNGVRNNVKVPLTQAQFDALTSFTFNLGVGALKNSTLLKKLNAGNYQEVPNELQKWVNAGGKRIPGLVTRRREEGLLFSTPEKA